jgi:hypothetical protein
MSNVSKICIKCNVDFRPHISNAKRNFTGLCGHCSRIEKNKARAFHTPLSQKLFNVWRTIKARCLNPKHKSFYAYSGKGVCDEWANSFPKFYQWSLENGYTLEKRLHIDRVDNSKGYSPDNCQWLTIKEHMEKDKGTKIFHLESKTRFESMRHASRCLEISPHTVKMVLEGNKIIKGVTLVKITNEATE